MKQSQSVKIANLVTVSDGIGTRNSIYAQLKEYVPEGATLESYSFEGGIPEKIYARVLLLTGESFYRRLLKLDAIWPESRIVIADRSINMECINTLISLGSKQTVLVANDSLASAQDAIDALQDIGFSSWNYIPFSPDTSLDTLAGKDITCVISVGEPKAVPEGFSPVYDIGTRIVSASTIAQVWSILGWPMNAVEKYFNKYFEQVISLTQQTYDIAGRLDDANRNLSSVINSVEDGMMVYERETGKITVCNTPLMKLAGIAGDISEKQLRRVIKHPGILEFLTAPSGQRDEMMVEWNGHTVMANRFPMNATMELCTFQTVDQIRKESSKLARELVQQGLYSKYSFDDILGTSEEICETKSRALRLAKTDLNILIEGESGTGKELFAAAIHRASSRSDKPYMAINFSSLNDSLMESELFGYEEGAFTGARRGGKAGVFEMANGGTIFLDEIGDISPKMQVGLLRVLQEKEVMRIGDGKVRYVDVRIIAATNQNLQEKVKQGLFREDLYYRLKIGYIYVPPLRNRQSDIAYLAQSLLEQDGGIGVTITPELFRWMEQQPWHGNVRELKNTVIYMNALRNSDTLDLRDLPEQQYFHSDPDIADTAFPSASPSVSGSAADTSDCSFSETQSDGDPLIQLIRQLTADGSLLGRSRLLEAAREHGLCTTEYQLRKRLTELEARGKIHMGRGKVGIQLT